MILKSCAWCLISKRYVWLASGGRQTQTLRLTHDFKKLRLTPARHQPDAILHDLNHCKKDWEEYNDSGCAQSEWGFVFSEYEPRKPLKCITGDSRLYDDVIQAVEGVDVVIHTAGIVSIGPFPDVLAMQNVNIKGRFVASYQKSAFRYLGIVVIGPHNEKKSVCSN